MKKSLILCAGLCLAISFASCGGSKESAYKKAYEKAKAQETQQVAPQETEAPVVTPLVEKPATQATVIDNTDNASVRSEAVTVVDGTGLSNFSVVVGSFSSKANALALQQRLKVRAILHRLHTMPLSISTVLSFQHSLTRAMLCVHVISSVLSTLTHGFF